MPPPCGARARQSTQQPIQKETHAGAARGCLLSPDDLKALQSFTLDLTQKSLLPDVERRMFNLNGHVTATRKGLRNTFKSWWRKPKPVMAAAPASQTMAAAYPWESTEAQIRLLADLAFVLQDYAFALSMFRLVREDYKSDKAWRHLGACLEMMALCLFMTEGSKSAQMGFLAEAQAAHARDPTLAPTLIWPRGTSQEAPLLEPLWGCGLPATVLSCSQMHALNLVH